MAIEIKAGVTGNEIKKVRENTRSWIAKVIILIFLAVIIVSCLLIFLNKPFNDFNSIISSLSGLVGVVLGFYFGKNLS